MAKKTFRNLGTEAASKFISTNEKSISDDEIQNAVTNTVENSVEPAEKVSVEKKEPIIEVSANNQESILQNQVVSSKSNSGKLWKDKSRTTVVLDDDVKEYLDVIIRLDGESIVQYLNKLLRNDMQVRAIEYEMAVKLFNKNKK